ncbi:MULTISPECIES: SpaH/EbpB family LPXTG-anchored major pilin [unclassified Enterococcus]|uniref:SpaH/EbpB family LPXTG-anchored major pilin n=1 Tax=unclassified Enterococcus TaxID=2608891 RepID=UPI000A34C19B|nr:MULTISPECIES: SpaH/EbpB family LPXTG-anchored major pilin [unclassified Enterococcus]OTO67750.1 hypothetical protein A5865_003429 [Enterococcus sp. 12E11_DIV0728]OUZ15688.1 hypothetical protein A5868_000599 [Enterococcus sp. 12F9_DIV0723]
MKNKRKWISKVAMTLGVLTMVSGTAVGAMSLGSSENVAHAAQTISKNPTSDNTTPRTITLWKYEIKSAAELGERGDGFELAGTAPELAGKTVMEDVHFEIIRVKAITGGAPLKDPLKQVAGTDYTVDTSFPTTTGKTDATGKLTFDASDILNLDGTTGKEHKLADGIYLIREIPNPDTGIFDYTVPSTAIGAELDPISGKYKKEISTPMNPFFAYLPQTKREKDPSDPDKYISSGELIYDVHVHPKNIVTDTELKKTVNGGDGYSIKAGEKFQWEATTKLPDGLHSVITEPKTITNMHDASGAPIGDLDITGPFPYDLYADHFKVIDDLNTDLLLEDIVVQTSSDGTTWSNLTIGTHYTVDLNGTSVAAHPVTNMTKGDPKKVTVSLTKDNATSGMKKVTDDNSTHIRVVYKTTVKNDFNGEIKNKYDVSYLIPGQKPITPTSNIPEYYTGGFNIKKVDDSGVDLSDAEFHIALTEADAKAKKFLASDGKPYTLNDDGTSTPALPTGVSYLTSKSDASGNAKFDGLKLDWFTDNPAGAKPSDGEQDPDDPSEATWPKTDPGDGKYIHKKYWIVETKSPAGYELLKTPQEVTVDLYTHDNAGPEITVENKSKTDLPFTGGTGTMLLVIIAIGSITIGTAAIAIDKKRRAV